MVSLAEAQTLLKQGNFADAMHLAQVLLWADDTVLRDQAEAHYIIGRSLLATGQYAGAVQALTQAHRLATDYHPDKLGLIEVNRGTAHLWLSDVALARELLETALSRPNLPDGWHGTATHNLGLIEETAGNMKAAIDLYNVARGHYCQAGWQREELDCTLSIAWCHLLQGEAESGKLALEEAESWSSIMPDLPIHNLTSRHWALYHRLIGDIPTSMAFCERALASRHASPKDHHYTLGEAAWVAALNALSMGRFEECKMFARMAMNHGLQMQWPLLINRANKLRIQADRALRQQ
jgi:tetratricopeptide (TPR) repeat protein